MSPMSAVDESASPPPTLHRLDAGLTFREIAETTGSPLGTTLGRMRQALNRLKPQLENLQ